MNVLIVKVNGSFVLYLLFADDFQVWEVLFDAVDDQSLNFEVGLDNVKNT